MDSNSPLIIGAGLSGLLAGSIFPRATIFEAESSEKITHKAVLRFRSPSVGAAVGIEFKKAKVYKGIWHNNRFQQPSIALANLYSRKVTGRLEDRSIWSIEPVERYIAPEDFALQMAERVQNRIHWETPFDWKSQFKDTVRSEIISTIPMPTLISELCEDKPESIEFNYAPIRVRRWRIKNANVYQTIYFPDPATRLYRASITGDLLIAEYMDSGYPFDLMTESDQELHNVFGINKDDLDALDFHKQKFGKISQLDNGWRRGFIHHLSTKYNIYSLGRFSVWANILLDDVLHDIHVVKRLMASSHYDRAISR